MYILKRIQDSHIEIFLKLCTIFGIILHIVPYLYNRSLWVDEAMLVSSICTRSLSELVASPLDWGQSAPVGYLFIVKIITMVWNTSEAALRIFSLFSAIVCIFIIYALLKDKVAPKFTLWATAVFSLTNGYIYYRNEAKSYMSDNIFCLLTLLIWQKYQENKLAFYQLCLIYAVLIWFSFSSVFFIGACMMIESIHQIRTNRIMKSLLSNAFTSSLVLTSLLAYYALWLSTTSTNVGEAGYWALLKFPILPTSLNNLKLVIRMLSEFCVFYSAIAIIFYTIVLFYLFLCIKQKKDISKIILPYAVAFFLLLIASSMGYYPIQGRILQMYPLIALIIVAFCSNEVSNHHLKIGHKSILFFIQLLLFLILIFVGFHGCRNLFAKNVYKNGAEVFASIDFIKKNLKDNDYIYVSRDAIPIYSYKTNYRVSFSDLDKLDSHKNDNDLLSSLPCIIDKTIYGQKMIKYQYMIPYDYTADIIEQNVLQDANIISKYESVYLFTSHGASGISSIIKILNHFGTVKTVVDTYNTRLYHFVRNNS